jgi:serine phosphatase RsbU (regulator of sigma subunit)
LFTAVVLTATSIYILTRTLASSLSDRTAQVALVLEGELSLHQRDLEHLSDLWTHDEQLMRGVNNDDWVDAAKTLGEFRADRHVDIAILLNSTGAIQSQVGIEASKAKAFVDVHARKNLGPKLPQSLIETVNGRVYIVSAQRLLYFGRTLGELVMAQEFTNEIASDISKKIGAQVVAFNADGPRASSVPSAAKLDQALKRIWSQIGTQKLLTIGSLPIGETSYYVRAFAMPASVTPEEQVAAAVAFAYAVAQTDIEQTQRRTLWTSLAVLVIITGLGVVLGLALANTIARPIMAMAEQFSRISASGDLSLRVQESETNEIGDMARSFNAMQERVEQLHGRVVQAEERMRKELQMASTVQEMLFQQAMPHNRACDVAAYTSTLVETSGDWYAVFDDPDAKRTVFVIADATGHGASAALLTAITHGFFQTMITAKQGGDTALARLPPSQILSMLNSVVLNSAHGTITATVFVGTLHHGSRKMVYGSAGHIPPIVTRWVDNEMKANILTCNPSSSIGSGEKPVYEDYTVELPADSLLVIYTDGLTEVENPAGLQWGVRKLISVLRGCQTDTVESVRQKVLDSCMQFARGKELQDDLTYLTVRIL